MSYDSQLDCILALAIGMSSGNASEGLEAVQNAMQNRVKNSNRLPRDMRPSQAAFEALGFTFTDIDDDVLFEATLPEGWSTQETPGSSILWENLVDNKGRIRGSYCYKGTPYNQSGYMSLSCRYRSTYQYTDPNNYDSPINVVVTDADGSVIFNAGQCKEAYSEEYDMLIAKTKEYLKSNYPEWKDVTKYWD